MRNKLTLVTGIGGDKQAGRLGIMTVVACGDDGGSDEQQEGEKKKAMMKFMSLTLKDIFLSSLVLQHHETIFQVFFRSAICDLNGLHEGGRSGRSRASIAASTASGFH